MKTLSLTKKTDPQTALIERALKQALPPESLRPTQVHEAMHYAVLNGGKRFRPRLVLAACEAVGGDPKKALPAALAVEFIHAYSLVHDDLPALDNDELRRGKPTCHRQFGEAIAILTGDALLTRAFQLLSEIKPARKANQLIQELTDAAGTEGMIGGQVADILLAKNGTNGSLNLQTVEYISQRKTGRLIQTSAVLGAMIGSSSSAKIKKIRQFGAALGLAFQVADDIMDGDGYLRLMDSNQARNKFQGLIQKAKREAQTFGKKGNHLIELSDFLLNTLNPS